MFFIITKLIQMLIIPPAGLIILMTAGFFILKKYRVIGKLLIVSGFVLLYFVSISPLSDFLMLPLEKACPQMEVTDKINAQAIVVLSNGVRDLSWMGIEPEPSGYSLERVIKGVELYWKLHLPVIIIGGSGDPARPYLREADAMALTVKNLGVPVKDIIAESSPRNTLESVGALKHVLAGKRIILVTSAYHMKRSAAFFKRQGFEIIAVPSGYLVEHRKISLYSFIPNTSSLSISSTALLEYTSLAWYSMSGNM